MYKRQRPNLQGKHTRQGETHTIWTPENFVEQLFEYVNRSRTKTFSEFRYGESGDFYTEGQVQWFADVSAILRTKNIVTYGYTARTDFDLTALVASSQVNLSNDKHHSALYQSLGANRFKAVHNYTGKADAICQCPALKKLGIKRQCENCNYCKVETGLIEEILRK